MAPHATADQTDEAKAAAAAEAAEAVAKAAAEAAERAAQARRYDAMFRGEDETRRRASLTLAEQPLFDAAAIGRRERFDAMSIDERKSYVEAQEALMPDARYAPDQQLSPEQQHETEVAQELLMVYLEKRPIPDKLAMTLLALVKAHNAPPPEGGALSARTAAERQTIKDEADAEKRARGR